MFTKFDHYRTVHRPLRLVVIALILGLTGGFNPLFGEPCISQDAASKLITMGDGDGQLTLRLNYHDGCALDQINVRGRDVTSEPGVFTGLRVGDQWFTSKNSPEPKVKISKHNVTVSGIQLGTPSQQIQETWTFTSLSNRIVWKITRQYSADETVADMAFPEWNFSDVNTWTGGMLDNGGVVWDKYLDRGNATYGGHFGAVTFWNVASNDCLRITPTLASDFHGAGRFSGQTNDVLSFYYAVTHEPLETAHGQNRFLGDRQDLWKPFEVRHSEVTAEFALQAFAYDKACDRGTFAGLDGNNIRDLLNTVARYGVIDSGLTGGNGWRSGYICLHEPFFAQIAATVDAADYTANLSAFLDNARDHAIETNGRVKSRWCYGSWDAMPGTYDQYGFYEAQWGYLMDSQPDYVMNVAEQFDLTGDQKWLASHKKSCERALAFLTQREVGNSGLVAMMTDSQTQQRGSDWIDIIWASYENAFVNAQLYAALNLWAAAEDALGDTNKAAGYRAFATRLKTHFNKPIADGGFWDPTKTWYAYWRDKDGSVHGDNLVTPVNFAAIAYGLCDDPVRQKAILDQMEIEMEKEKLFYWPLCFFSYKPEEGAGSNFPFPKYENGDIFLSWGELGVRAYAAYNPALALKYVKNTLDRYAKDGLSFQRYLRQDQRGEGDDILAGNCMPIVGLYRDIYGVQPKPNRLYLEPHLTSELNGTKLRYNLRGQLYEINLHTEGSSIMTGNCKIGAEQPFAVNATKTGIQFFQGTNSDWGMSISPAKNTLVEVNISSWTVTANSLMEWTEVTLQHRGRVSHIIKGLRPGATYKLFIDGDSVKSLHADQSGQTSFELSLSLNAVHQIKITAQP